MNSGQLCLLPETHAACDDSAVASEGREDAISWPRRHDVLGVLISPTTYDEAVATVVAAVRGRQPAIVSLHAVHALVTAAGDSRLRNAVNQFHMIAPDGQPVRWALNWLYKTRLRQRVYGPELMLRLCSRAADEGISIYLYGSSPDVIEELCERLTARYPGLEIAGAESPPFRPLSPEEDAAVVARIEASGAGIVFIGLGAPKQDWFAYEHRNRISGVQLCVGAAFDFHAGKKSTAPAWMQRLGMEWFYRLCQEPRRLWRRYLVTNTTFVIALGRQVLSRQRKTVLQTD